MKADGHNYFKKVYNETYSNILKYVISRCNNSCDVQDIVQNTYMNIFVRIQKYGIFHFRNINKYIYKIAYGELTKYHKDKMQKQNLVNIEDDEVGFIDASFLLEERVCDSIEEAEIWNIIKQKDCLTFKICTLYFIYDYPLIQISGELNISQSTVKNRLYRTINEIKELFKDKEEL